MQYLKCQFHRKIEFTKKEKQYALIDECIGQIISSETIKDQDHLDFFGELYSLYLAMQQQYF